MSSSCTDDLKFRNNGKRKKYSDLYLLDAFKYEEIMLCDNCSLQTMKNCSLFMTEVWSEPNWVWKRKKLLIGRENFLYFIRNIFSSFRRSVKSWIYFESEFTGSELFVSYAFCYSYRNSNERFPLTCMPSEDTFYAISTRM